MKSNILKCLCHIAAALLAIEGSGPGRDLPE